MSETLAEMLLGTSSLRDVLSPASSVFTSIDENLMIYVETRVLNSSCFLFVCSSGKLVKAIKHVWLFKHLSEIAQRGFICLFFFYSKCTEMAFCCKLVLCILNHIVLRSP